MSNKIHDLAVFDLDQTLIDGDSDYLWGQFLSQSGHVDPVLYEAANRRFYHQYMDGTLDIHEFAEFSMAPLAQLDSDLLTDLRQRFLGECIEPAIAHGAPALLEQHRNAGHELIITTATNRFITEPIASLLGVNNLLATEPEVIDGRYTGRLAGIPNFREGKALRLRMWIDQRPNALGQIHAYSDSHNDLPLLELAHHPIAVDPDPRLRQEAKRRGWPIISLRKVGQ